MHWITVAFKNLHFCVSFKNPQDYCTSLLFLKSSQLCTSSSFQFSHFLTYPTLLFLSLSAPSPSHTLSRRLCFFSEKSRQSRSIKGRSFEKTQYRRVLFDFIFSIFFYIKRTIGCLRESTVILKFE